MNETSILISGHAVYEPVTVLTNLFISASCLYFFFRIKHGRPETRLREYWRYFFFYIGLSAFLGGIAHGFKPYFSEPTYYVLWMAMNVTNLPASYYLLKAGIEISDFRPELVKTLNQIVIAYIIIAVLLTILLNNFVLIKINALIVIVFTIIQHYKAWKKGLPGNGYIWGAYTFSLTALIVHTAKFSISEWFNFKDISHVIMNITLILLFIGVRIKTLPSVPDSSR